MIEPNKIYLGNNIDLLRQMPDNSVDSVVTDPPYGISFMNKKWDYDVPSVETWQEVLRVLKPGGHALVACGTRTQHRMACNLEDAGFEIRDIVAWIYGSGFPKSLNIGKEIDKRGGKQVAWFGKWLRSWREEKGISQKEIARLFPSASGGMTGCVANWELGFNIPTAEQFSKIVKAFNLPFETIEEAEREITGTCITNKTVYQNIGQPNISGEIDITAPSTPEAQKWDGWGTALKPAMELWTLCRKPTEGTIAENVLKYGVGGINIDECRVETNDFYSMPAKKTPCAVGYQRKNKSMFTDKSESSMNANGRFPANVIHDGSEEVVGLFPNENGENPSRFFYTAKASQSERNNGLWGFEEVPITDGREKPIDNAFNRGMTQKRNIHPTVKPVKLMQYLCRLITPKDGVVLDPYAGSGSTLIAAKMEKFNYIGFEVDPKYVKIAEARITAAIAQYDIFDFIGNTEKINDGQMALF